MQDNSLEKSKKIKINQEQIINNSENKLRHNEDSIEQSSTQVENAKANLANEKEQFQSKISIRLDKPFFKEKLKALRRKKEKLKHALYGQKRKMRKYLMNYRRQSKKNREDLDESEELDTSFSQNELEQGNEYSNNQNQEKTQDQNTIYSLMTSKTKKILSKRTKRFQSFNYILPVPEGKKFHFKLIRRNIGLKIFAPEFDLIDQNNETVLFCKKTNIFTFSFCSKFGQWDQRSEFYIGKLVSNVSGSILNFLYKGGTEQKCIYSVEYINGFFQFKKPRKITVYIVDPALYSEQEKYNKVISLRYIHQKQQENSNIISFENRCPSFNKRQNSYSLDFHGRALVSSVKNFILEQPKHRGREYLLFAKRDENEYNLDFMNPFSQLSAFVVAITSFNGKVICQ